VSRSCLEKIGGFHPAFFMYGEDHEFLNRARHAGFRSGVLANAFICHHRNQHPEPKSGVRKNLTSNYLGNEARLIVLDPGLPDAEKWSRLRRLYWRTVLRSVRFVHPGVFGLLRTIREAARQARTLGPEAALNDLRLALES
jgi:GT2 family glycosyltransferase